MNPQTLHEIGSRYGPRGRGRGRCWRATGHCFCTVQVGGLERVMAGASMTCDSTGGDRKFSPKECRARRRADSQHHISWITARPDRTRADSASRCRWTNNDQVCVAHSGHWKVGSEVSSPGADRCGPRSAAFAGAHFGRSSRSPHSQTNGRDELVEWSREVEVGNAGLMKRSRLRANSLPIDRPWDLLWQEEALREAPRVLSQARLCKSESAPALTKTQSSASSLLSGTGTRLRSSSGGLSRRDDADAASAAASLLARRVRGLAQILGRSSLGVSPRASGQESPSHPPPPPKPAAFTWISR